MIIHADVGNNCKMKRAIINISILIMLLLSSCKTTPNLSSGEVYKIINEIISDDSILIYRVCQDFQNLPLTGDYIKEFTNQDIDFNKNQRINLSGLKIEPQSIQWYSPRFKTLSYSVVDTTCKEGILYHITFPIVSRNRQKVLIEFIEDCNCSLGGQGGKRLYERENGRWIRKKVYDHWIG